MIRIVHISNTDISVDSRIRKELRALGQLPGAHVRVLGVPETNEEGCSELDGARYERLRMRARALKVCPRAVRYFFELIEFTVKAVWAARRVRPDIVHCHDTFALPAGWLLKKLLGCRLVYDAHELESNKNAQNAVLSWATLLIERACWKQIDLLISVSDSIIAWYAQNLGAKPSILVLNAPAIPAGFDVPVAPGRGTYFHHKYGIPADELVFIYLGMLSPGRGIEICLDAFAAGPRGAHIVFMGFGQLERTVREYAARHPNIHFHETVPHDQVVPLVRSADYGLCLVEKASLSDFYCLPNKLFEYCFARVPVLASRFPEISRLVEQYSLGVCCDPEPASVRAALDDLTKRGAARITSDISALSWEAQAARLTAAYREHLMGAPGIPSVQ